MAIAAPSVRALAQAADFEPDPLMEERARKRLEGLKRDFVYELQQEQYHTAIDIAMEIHDLDPARGIASFNLARVYSRINDVDRSLEWLRTAIDEGFCLTKLLREDPNLTAVGKAPEFIEIVEASEANRLAQFEQIKQEFERSEMYSHIPAGIEPDRPVPLIVALHGAGTTGADIGEAWLSVARKRRVALIAPNAPRRIGDVYTWLFPDESKWIIERAIERATSTQPVDPSRILLTGFDEGAGVAYDLIMAEPHLYLGAIPICGHFPLDPEPPSDLPNDQWPRFYFLAGEQDALRRSSDQLTEQLGDIGFRYRYHVFPNSGHTLPVGYEAELEKALDFLLEE